MHVHAQCADGEAKFRLEPRIERARNFGLNQRQLYEVRTLIEAHCNEFCSAWTRHFGRLGHKPLG